MEHSNVSTNYLQTKFDQINIGIALFDYNMHWLKFNQKILLTLGYSADELSKLTWYDVFISHNEETLTNLLNQLQQDIIQSFEIDSCYICKNTEKRFAHITFSKYNSDIVQSTVIVATVQDITISKQYAYELECSNSYIKELVTQLKRELKARRNIEEELRLFFTTAKTLLGVINFDGYFIKVSDEWGATLGWDKTTFIKHHYSEFIYYKDKIHSDNFLAMLQQTHDKGTCTNRWHCKDGKIIWLASNARVIRERNIIVIAATDITKQKEIEHNLCKAKLAAEKASKLKSEFLAHISHEIRTPLNAIIGYSELLNANAADHKTVSYVNAINTAGKNLLTLVTDILDISKIEAGMMDIKISKIELKSFLQEIYQLFYQTAQKANLNFSLVTNLPDNIIYQLDELKLRQILINLIGNALKFTKQGYITITATAKQTPNNLYILTFNISDSGIGMPKTALKAIFRAFYQHTTAATPDYTNIGTGLGLTISQNLAKLLGGKITVISQENCGSSFTLTLPNINAAAADHTQPPNERSSENNHLLTMHKTYSTAALPLSSTKLTLNLDTLSLLNTDMHQIIQMNSKVVKISSIQNLIIAFNTIAAKTADPAFKQLIATLTIAANTYQFDIIKAAMNNLYSQINISRKG